MAFFQKISRQLTVASRQQEWWNRLERSETMTFGEPPGLSRRG
jgi:hypothetical protein